jgi:hypothetical protein
MTDLTERLRLGDGTSPDHALLLDAANEIDRLTRCRQNLVDVIDNYCIAMQSALIDATLRGYPNGLKWIWNTLVGPGLLPDFDAAEKMGGAQAWFDAKTAESEALKLNAV